MRLSALLVLGATALSLTTGCDSRINPLTGVPGSSGSGSPSFNISPSTVTLSAGESTQLVLNSARAIGPYTWTSNQAGIASVTSSGLVTAIGTGLATITVTSAVDRTVSASATITVRSANTPSP